MKRNEVKLLTAIGGSAVVTLGVLGMAAGQEQASHRSVASSGTQTAATVTALSHPRHLRRPWPRPTSRGLRLSLPRSGDGLEIDGSSLVNAGSAAARFGITSRSAALVPHLFVADVATVLKLQRGKTRGLTCRGLPPRTARLAPYPHRPRGGPGRIRRAAKGIVVLDAVDDPHNADDAAFLEMLEHAVHREGIQGVTDRLYQSVRRTEHG